MEDEFEAMKLFKGSDAYSFILNSRLQPHIVSALKRLEQDNMIECVWSLSLDHPMDCELTEKGFQLLEYLKNNEWD